MTLGNETRASLTPPLGSGLTFTLKLPANPVLRLGTGLASLESSAKESAETDSGGSWATMRRVDFRIHIESDGNRETVFSESMHRHETGRWFDRRVELGSWADKTVRLTFEALPPERFRNRVNDQVVSALSQVLPLWANPVLLDASPSKAVRKVILISIDCLRADHVGVYGYPHGTTPHIDRFAEDAVVFTTALSNAPSTLPSHTSMFTGLEPSLHGASKWRKLDRAVPYLPEILSQSGFQADGVVTGPYLSHWFGFERGFHSYAAYSDPPADVAVDAALEALERGRGMDQFVFLHLFDPHWPYLPPAELIERLDDRPDISNLLDYPKYHKQPPNPRIAQHIMELYDAEITHVDRQIGRFLDALKSQGLYEESHIILTADHGEAFYEHGHWQHSTSLYEELIHVPLIVKWPGPRLRGKIDALASHIDIFPTVLGELEIPMATISSGLNLRKYAEGTDHIGSRKVVSEFNWLLDGKNVVKVSFRAPELKYIATVHIPPGEEVGPDKIQEEELFDLSSDPHEQHDISASRPESVSSFRKMLLDYLMSSRKAQSISRGEEILLDEATKEQLRNLGYIH